MFLISLVFFYYKFEVNRFYSNYKFVIKVIVLISIINIYNLFNLV